MKNFIIRFLVLSCFLVLFASPFASSRPDGLERFAADQKFLGLEKSLGIYKSPLADYDAVFVKNDYLKSGISGIIGVFMVFSLTYFTGRLIVKSKVS